MTLLLCCVGEVVAQAQKVMSGTVTELIGKTADPLVGVNVNIVNAQNRSLGGSITNLNGQYNVKIPEGENNLTIVFSYIGMKTQRVKYTGQTNLNIRMESESKTVDEVVVSAKRIERNDLGITNKEMISATQKVNMDDLVAAAPIVSVEEALQGQLGGVDIVLGGDPGTRSSIRIRGTGTLNASADPLIVIDGVPYPTDISDDFDFSTANEEDLGALLNISPNDIATVEVLKDASASAVYGARAAYGVVLVTTKSGKKERASVTYRGTVGFSAPINMPKMMNALEYAAYNNQQYDNGGASSGLQKISDKTIEKIKGFMQNPYSAEFPGIEANTTGDDWAGAYYNQYGNTDWFEYYFKDKSVRHSHNLSVQGGSDKVNYYIGMGYTYQEGLLDKVQDDLSKYNLNTKLQFKTSDWLRFNLNNNITLQMIKRPMANQMILYNKIGSHRPTQVTELPVESEYNIP